MGLGLWAAGGGWGPVEESETIRVIHQAVEHGVNFFDTADVYGNGLSEEILGRAMRGNRHRYIVATKIGWIGYDGTAGRSAFDTVDKVTTAAEHCLKRLGTDHIDLLQSHIFYREPNTDILIEGLVRLKERGLIRAYGVSTGSLDFAADFASNGNCASVQLDYSLLNRFPEGDLLPWCEQRGIATIIRGPLAMGILTGKLTADSRFTGSNDHRRQWVENPEARAVYLEDLARVEQLRALTSPRRSMAQLALQFVLQHPAVSVVIPGARDLAQLRENLAAMSAPPLTQEELRRIDSIVAPAAGRRIWPA